MNPPGRRRHRMRLASVGIAVVVVPACLAGAASTVSGCGTSGDEAGLADATSDGHLTILVPNDDAPPVIRPDAGVDGGGPPRAGNCSPVDSPECDVVLNDCPASEAGVPGECLPGNGDASATCTFARPSQHLPAGHTCCPSADAADEPCLSGSECIGDPCIDGGMPSGRCSPRCCDDTACGDSPEGIAGHCSLTLVNQEGDSLYNVCTYDRPCKSFHVQPCPDGEVCVIEDHLGTSSCADLFLPNGGDGSEGQSCTASNSCAEGLTCLSTGDDDDASAPDAGDDDGGSEAGSGDDDVGQCFYECIVGGTTPPFDAGPNAAPGYGGCPEGEICNAFASPSSPLWLGYCASP